MTSFLTVRGKSFVAAGTVLVLAGVGLGVRDLTRIGILALVLPVVAAFFTRRERLEGITVTRLVTPSRVRPDHVTEIEVRITNTGKRRTPLLMAEELVAYSLGDRPRFVVAPMRPGGERVVHYGLRPTARGRHQVGPLAIGVRDVFGLTSRAASHSAHTDVIVLPRTYALNQNRSMGSELGSEGTIPHHISLHGEEDSSIREYRDGDDLRHIHWPATARTGDLMVRQEDRPARRRAIVLLDTRAEVHRSKGPASSLEWSVSATASIALHLLAADYAVHVVTGGDRDQVGEDLQAEALLDQLAEVSATTASEWIAAVHHASTLGATGGMVIAITGPMAETDALSMATTRSSGSTGLALVVTDHDADGGTEDAAKATAAALRGVGWSATAVTPRDDIARTWALINGGHTVGGQR